jgi:CYTH domain-containing protein
MLSVNGLEIERKFLIKYPNVKSLLSMENCRVKEISQSYLSTGGRIRKIKEQGKTTYIKTVKKHITNLTREEKEWEITKEEYFSLLKDKKENTNTIEKTRYAVSLNGFIYEIDVFSFWKDRAFLEVELKNENQEFPIPDFIEIIKEVTDDKRYRNSALAKEIVWEDIN